MKKTQKPTYVTVAQLSKLYPAFSESSLRWIVYNSKENGFSKCIRRIGKKIVINTYDFENWIESRQEPFINI